jgi:hypothetical protein
MNKCGQIQGGRLLRAALVGLAVVLVPGAGPVLAATAAPAAVAAGEDTEARAILRNMADCLARAQGFRVEVRSGYDAIQQSGQRVEFGERRRILLRRPDLLRVETERSDGVQGLVLFDGKGITAFRPEENVYARVEKPGTVDGAIVYLVRDLQITLPLAPLFLTALPQYLDKRIESVAYVEEDALFDVPTDHLAARGADVDLQVWIAQGEQPVPRRIVITYKTAEGQPQFWADLSGWDLSPEAAADRFSFTPPAGAEHVPFLAPVRARGSLPAQKGGAQ